MFKPTQQDLALMNSTKKLAELELNIIGGANKRPQMTKEITNLWCNICKSHGHLSNECPTLKQIRIKCSLGGIIQFPLQC